MSWVQTASSFSSNILPVKKAMQPAKGLHRFFMIRAFYIFWSSERRVKLA